MKIDIEKLRQKIAMAQHGSHELGGPQVVSLGYVDGVDWQLKAETEINNTLVRVAAYDAFTRGEGVEDRQDISEPRKSNKLTAIDATTERDTAYVKDLEALAALAFGVISTDEGVLDTKSRQEWHAARRGFFGQFERLKISHVIKTPGKPTSRDGLIEQMCKVDMEQCGIPADDFVVNCWGHQTFNWEDAKPRMEAILMAIESIGMINTKSGSEV